MEDLIKTQGYEKYLKNLKKQIANGRCSNTDIILAFEKKLVNKLSTSLQEKLDYLNKKKAGKSLNDLRLLNQLDCSKIAFCSISVILDVLLKEPQVKYNTLCVKIGKALNDEIVFKKFKEEKPELFKQLNEKYDGTRSYSYVSRAYKFHANRNNIEEYSTEQKAKFGALVINEIDKTVGLITTYKEKYRKGYIRLCKLHEQYKEYIDEIIELRASMNYDLKAITEPPKPWTSMYDGGYHSLDNIKFIKSSNDKILNQTPKESMKAVNIIQKTGYTVNQKVLKVMKEMNKFDNSLFYKGENFDKLVKPAILKVSEEERERISKIQMKNKILRKNTLYNEKNEVQKEFWRAYHGDKDVDLFDGCKELMESMNEIKDFDKESQKHRSLKNIIHLRQKNNFHKIIRDKSIIKNADLYGNQEIYFPCSTDFRGRIYALPNFLTYQGDDKAKGLLLFSKGKKITDKGINWYKIHGANLFGLDKKPYKTRISWLNENEENIKMVARDPISNIDFWSSADEPFQFLAFCFEYDEFVNSGYSPDFISRVICFYDATNNALQHYSAILREEKTAFLTNLINSDEVQDIYQLIADKVNIIINSDMSEAASLWRQFGVDRKLAKKPTMTYLYGSSIYGFTQQIQKVIESEIENIILFKDKFKQASYYIAGVFSQVIEEELVSAYHIRNKLREIISLALSKELKSVEYINPVGFNLVSDYRIFERQEISINLDRKRIKINIANEDAEINKRKIINSIAANFIHSLDSSHLTMTVNEFDDDIAVVHDCFGVHACNAGKLHSIARNEFVNLHSENQINNFIQQINENFDLNIEEIEDLNEFDINEVLKSNYFIT
jgi:DNA-directed RNA polymerase